MPSDSMNRSYGVLGRPNSPKPARSLPLGSCQCVLPVSSCIATPVVEAQPDECFTAGPLARQGACPQRRADGRAVVHAKLGYATLDAGRKATAERAFDP